MSGELASTLWRRARVLLGVAEELVERGEYDLALAMAEQAPRLGSRAVYAMVVARIPKGHNLRRLIGYLAGVLEEAGAVDAAEERRALILLEDAYTQGRYALPGYTRRDAEEGIGAARRLLELLERLFWRTPST